MHDNNALSSRNIRGNIAIALKEGLRGARYMALTGRMLFLQLVSKLPFGLKTPITKSVHKFDVIAQRVDEETSKVVHHYLDPSIARDSDNATFSKIIARDDASVVFAKTSYDNLKQIVNYLSPHIGIEQKFFISEMLSACAFRKAFSQFQSVDGDHTRAAILVEQLLQQGAIRTQTSSNAAKSDIPEIAQLARVSCFANMLWLSLARDYVPDREEDLLYACCDLALVIDQQIEDATGDIEKFGELLKYHAEIV